MSLKTISTKIIHKNPWCEYKHDKYLLPNKSEYDYFYLKTNGCVKIIPVLEDGRLLLIRQYRYLQDKNGIEFVAGGIIEGESPSESAQRELLEETGYQTGELIKIGEFEPNNGCCIDNAHLFVATDLKKVNEPTPESSEILEMMYRRVDEFEKMIKQGEIWDGLTLAAWAIGREYVRQLVN